MIIRSVVEANTLVQLLLLSLFFMSIISWAIIAYKTKLIFKISITMKSITKIFSSQNLRVSELKDKLGNTTIEKNILDIAVSNSHKFKKCKSLNDVCNTEMVLNGNIDCTAQNLKNKFNRLTHLLGTIANIAPYVGLLGTVIGLLDAFAKLGDLQTATFQTVAPNITEAMFATAVGLFVAIPASLAYNILNKQISSIAMNYHTINKSVVNQLANQQLTNILSQK